MVFHRALADVEIGGDVFARVAIENHGHDLALPRSEARDVPGCELAPVCKLVLVS